MSIGLHTTLNFYKTTKRIYLHFIFVLLFAASAYSQTGSIQLSASRQVIQSDGKSVATISAVVRDSSGNLVPDDTEIRFSASLGIIEESAYTSSGVARVKITSSQIAGKAIITATWIEASAVSQMEMIFSEDYDASARKDYFTIKADHYMVYAIDMRVMFATGGAVLKMNDITVKAHTIQVDLLENKIIAKGLGRDKPVQLTYCDDSITCELFSIDTFGYMAYMISAERGGLETVRFVDKKIDISKPDNIFLPEMFDMFDTDQSVLHVQSKQAIVYPGNKIYFKNAGIAPGRKKMFSLPNYLLSLTGTQADGSQYLGYGSSGLTLSLPYHYSLTPSSNGSIMLKYGERSSWSEYGQVPGWFVDIKQDYISKNSQGSLVFNDVVSSDWGVRYSHNQELGSKTNANFYFDYPAHKDLYGTLNLSKSFSGFSMNIDLDGNHDRYDNTSTSSTFSLQTKSAKIRKTNISFNVSGSVSKSRREWGYDNQQKYTVDTSTQRISTNLATTPISLSKNIKLRSSLGLGYQWQDSTNNQLETTGLTTIGSSVLDWKLSKNNKMQLSYRYIQRPSYTRSFKDGKMVDTKPARQSISANWRFGKPDKWIMSIYGIKGLDYPNMSLFGTLNYRINSQWRLGVRATSNLYKHRVYANGNFVEHTNSYDDVELVLGKKFGDQEIAAVWSKSDGRILFELGSGAF